MKLRSYLLHLLFQLMLILLGVFGSIFCLMTAFSFPVPPGLIGCVILIAVINCLFLPPKKAGKVAALVLFGALLLLTFLLRKELVESFRNLWGELGRLYAKGYDIVQDYLPRDPTSVESVDIALVFIAIVQTFVCSISICRWRQTIPVVLILLPGVVPCFVLTDTPPALIALLAVVFSILVQVFSQSVRRRDLGEINKSLTLSTLLSAVILGALLLLFPRDTYSPPISWDDLSTAMSNWSQRQNNLGNLRAGLTGNPDSVDLQELGALPNHPVPYLYAIAPLDGSYYLRGSSYNEFDGKRWERGEQRSWATSDFLRSFGAYGSSILSIQTVSEEPVLFTTYHLARLPTGAKLVADAYVENSGKLMNYAVRFLPAPIESYQPENAYSDWVKQTCLEVPEQTREGVLAWWETHRGNLTSESPLITSNRFLDTQGDSEHATNSDAFYSSSIVGDGVFSQVRYAQQVANRVAKCTRYSRNPDPVPEDVDFCTWFLNDAKSGYCVHYATACTALLRSLGIPARYVTGYVCSLKANQSTPVTNLHAHAWVEIWCNGYWCPIEPTPQNATEFTGSATYSSGGEGPGVPIPSETQSHLSQPIATDTLPPMPEETRPTRPTRESTAPTEPDSKGGAQAAAGSLTLLWCLLGVLGLTGLIVGRRAVKRKLWEKRLAGKGCNEQATLLYRRLLQIVRLSEAEIPEEATQLAQKASFSQHTLEVEELAYLRQVLDHASRRLEISDFWKKLYAKYILAII